MSMTAFTFSLFLLVLSFFVSNSVPSNLKCFYVSLLLLRGNPFFSVSAVLIWNLFRCGILIFRYRCNVLNNVIIIIYNLNYNAYVP